jgi:IS1 family transposase
MGVIDHVGDTWTWTALDTDSKLVVSWLVGGRDSSSQSLSWMICGAA